MEGGELITCCPMLVVPGWCWELIGLCGHADNGVLPVAGGILDQTQAFIDGWAQVRTGREEMKAGKHG
jgi:hypothetical protein